MGRKRGRYTPLGEKIGSLATNQAELAEVLDLTQQSVSGKLTGKIAVTLHDIEVLSEHYNIPLIFFLTPPQVTVHLARVWTRIFNGPPELHAAVEIACDLPRPFLRELLMVVEAMQSTAAYCQGQGELGNEMLNAELDRLRQSMQSDPVNGQ
jgi:transcriptional regulator with XRE-family HTH domain